MIIGVAEQISATHKGIVDIGKCVAATDVSLKQDCELNWIAEREHFTKL